MKELETWEVIKELMRDKSKVFEATTVGGNKTIIFIEDYIDSEDVEWGEVVMQEFFNRIKQPLELLYGFENKGVLNFMWTEVIKPVDFITAYQICKQNGCKYKQEKNPKVTMFGYEGRVTIHNDVEYGNTIGIDCMWVRVD